MGTESLKILCDVAKGRIGPACLSPGMNGRLGPCHPLGSRGLQMEACGQTHEAVVLPNVTLGWPALGCRQALGHRLGWRVSLSPCTARQGWTKGGQLWPRLAWKPATGLAVLSQRPLCSTGQVPIAREISGLCLSNLELCLASAHTGKFPDY